MPLYPGSKRFMKASKDSGNRAPIASIVSLKTHSTSKGLRPPTESTKKGGHPAMSKSNTSSADAQKTQVARDPKFKATGPESKVPNVFEYLESNSDSNSDSDHSFSEDDDILNNTPNTSYVSSKTPHLGLARQTDLTAQGANARSRTSSVKSKGSKDAHQASALLSLSAKNNTSQRKMPMEGYLTEDSNNSEKQNLHLKSRPETYYPYRKSASSQRPPLPPSPPQSPEEDPHRLNRRSRRNTQSSHVSSGYGLLTWQLSSSVDKEDHCLPPLYRRFENLNHRVLLYLQDEIAQMEEELGVLDEYEELNRISTAEQERTKIVPASRRMDAQAQVYSSLHYRREEIMTALTHKTQQYNNALSAYSKVLQTLPSASDKDIDTYRNWMDENSPIALAETRFLDHSKDLVSLASRAVSSPTPVFSAIIIASAAILLPLLAFSMISEFSGRLLIVAVVGGAASAIASKSSTGAEQLVASQDGWRTATLYFGFMSMAAMFIP
ncbi:hypothetical protein BDV29DRAFT_117466 [Aspergillus leporis]|uniref:DUF6594 domain-containing protein n=1 Tax=Aspergillus leporis TaxID=41062 RepID=A0A5N5X248_9EURO|nr:hypothetical protein BDV29DRAFT_117466 [Aspergillus leporis]